MYLNSQCKYQFYFVNLMHQCLKVKLQALISIKGTAITPRFMRGAD